MSKVRIYIESILLPVLVGVVIGLITTGSMDYNSLKQPFLAPPGFIFPIVWTILYTLMGVSYGILKSNKQIDDEINFIYYIQLEVNALWSIIFCTLKWRFFAFLWIILLIILVIDMIRKFYRKNRTAGLLQLPYFAWLLFAAYLNLSIYLLNR